MRCHLFAAAALLAAAFPTRAVRADDVSVVTGTDAIEFKVGPETVAKYVTAKTAAKPYLWPVLAPGGVPVTRGWPMEKGKTGETTDHVHQKSVWFCHGDVIPDGVELKTKTTEKGGRGVDFWSEARDRDGTPRHGTITCVKVGEPKQHAPDHSSVTTWNEWKSPDGVKILDEERTIHFHVLPEGRLITFECRLTASVCPITFGDTKEGSFGIRVRDELRMQKQKGYLGGDGVLSNDAGKAGEKDVWGYTADWCDYSGPLDGKTAGVAVFSDPRNPPAAWHARAYGLLAANPFGREKAGFPSQKGKTDLVRIEKGKELTLRYGVYAHSGDVKGGKVAEAFEAFKK